jgi:RNA polymerase-binding protein DksA
MSGKNTTKFEDLPKFEGYYSEAELADFRAYVDGKLDETREELGRAIERVENTTAEAAGDTSYTLHMADQGTDAMEREKAFLFAQRDEKYLQQLQKAIERIEHGVFGICRQCGVKITEKRMKAVPTTNICIDCKSENEAAKRR